MVTAKFAFSSLFVQHASGTWRLRVRLHASLHALQAPHLPSTHGATALLAVLFAVLPTVLFAVAFSVLSASAAAAGAAVVTQSGQLSLSISNGHFLLPLSPYVSPSLISKFTASSALVQQVSGTSRWRSFVHSSSHALHAPQSPTTHGGDVAAVAVLFEPGAAAAGGVVAALFEPAAAATDAAVVVTVAPGPAVVALASLA
jgi:hypothetical protein